MMRRIFASIVMMVALFAVVGIAAADEVFHARLSGDEEVPPVVTNTTGSFKIRFNNVETEAEYTLKVRDGVRVTQAHFHCAPRGQNGSIVVFLAGFHAPGWDVDGLWISNAFVTDANIVDPACGSNLSELAQQIRDGNVYVNVHTVDHPPGEIRGQLH